MEKKTRTKSAKAGSKTKKGAKYVCDACGVVVAVDKECGCDPCDIVCCGQAMTPLARC